MKRAKGIWESSPYKTWKFLGIPLVGWGAVVSLVYLGILFYFLIFTEEMKDSNGKSWILYGIVWVIGIVWYFFWAAPQQGASVSTSASPTGSCRRSDRPARLRRPAGDVTVARARRAEQARRPGPLLVSALARAIGDRGVARRPGNSVEPPNQAASRERFCSGMVRETGAIM